jgi:hypothetical protein
MKRNLLFLILLLSIFFVSCATEKSIQEPSSPQEKCEAPRWNEGDSWKFTGDGEWEEKIVIKDGKLQINQTPKKEFYGFGGLEMESLFPLWIGKSWAGGPTLQTAWGSQLNYNISLKVVDLINIQIKAGTFECYKLEFRISTVGSQEGIAYFYYSEKTKSIVKFITYSSLLTYWENYELSSFNLRGEK